MITIRELMNKIKWDKRESPSDYDFHYYDRIANKLIKVSYNDIKRTEDNFIIIEKAGNETMIPMHRIRKVEKKGVVVWER